MMNKAEKLMEVSENPIEKKHSFRRKELLQQPEKDSIEQTVEMPTRKARVQSVKENTVVLRMQEQDCIARVAFSCMIQPRIGDIVLCAKDEMGAYYVISIIERQDINQSTLLAFPDDVIVKTPGTVSVTTDKSINLMAEEQFNCISKSSLHQYEKMTVSSEEIVAQGSRFSGVFQKLDIVSKVIHAFSERFVRKSQSYIRQTAINDQVSAEQITRHAEKLCSIKSETTMMKSDKETFIDGDHVFTSL